MQLPFVDQSPLVSRRLGFAVLPFGCLIIRVSAQLFDMLSDGSHIDECTPPSGGSRVRRGGLANFFTRDNLAAAVFGWGLAALSVICAWACAVGLKLLIGINLRAYAAARYTTYEARMAEDHLNGAARSPIGLAAEERADVERLRGVVNLDEFDARTKPAVGSKIPLEKLGRFDMVKSRVG